MSGKKSTGFNKLLNNPEVQEITSNMNQELMERRRSIPPKIDVFSYPYTYNLERGSRL
jgi:hypothetical protein